LPQLYTDDGNKRTKTRSSPPHWMKMGGKRHDPASLHPLYEPVWCLRAD